MWFEGGGNYEQKVDYTSKAPSQTWEKQQENYNKVKDTNKINENQEKGIKIYEKLFTRREDMDVYKRIMLIRNHPIFKRFPDKYLQKISYLVKDVNYCKNQPVFEQGAPSENVYLIIEGKFRIYENISNNNGK